jgi:Flp pilus assembly protein TadG
MTRQRSRSDRGAAVVEFALVVPLLLMLVIGIAEFGRAFFVHANMAAAAREGVRVEALANPPAGGALGTTRARAVLGLTQPSISSTGCAGGALDATVTITWAMPTITSMFGTTLPLTAKGVMKCNG